MGEEVKEVKEVKQADGGKQKAEGKNAEVLKSTPSTEILQMKSDIEAIKILLVSIRDVVADWSSASLAREIIGEVKTQKLIEYKPKEKKKFNNKK